MVNRGSREGGRHQPAPFPGLPDVPSAGTSAGREGTEPPLPVPATPCPAEPGGVRHRFGWHREPGRGRAAPAPPGHGKWHSGTDMTPPGTACPAPGSTCGSPAPVFPSSPFFPPNFAACQQHRPEQGCPTRPHCATSLGRGPGAELTPTCHFWNKSHPSPTKNTAEEPLCVPRQSHRANTDPADRPPAKRHGK